MRKKKNTKFKMVIRRDFFFFFFSAFITRRCFEEGKQHFLTFLCKHAAVLFLPSQEMVTGTSSYVTNAALAIDTDYRWFAP